MDYKGQTFTFSSYFCVLFSRTVRARHIIHSRDRYIAMEIVYFCSLSFLSGKKNSRETRLNVLYFFFLSLVSICIIKTNLYQLVPLIVITGRKEKKKSTNTPFSSYLYTRFIKFAFSCWYMQLAIACYTVH